MKLQTVFAQEGGRLKSSTLGMSQFYWTMQGEVGVVSVWGHRINAESCNLRERYRDASSPHCMVVREIGFGGNSSSAHSLPNNDWAYHLCLFAAIGSRVKGKIWCCYLKSSWIIKTLSIFTVVFSKRLKIDSAPGIELFHKLRLLSSRIEKLMCSWTTVWMCLKIGYIVRCTQASIPDIFPE